jgi:hypothetical protein
MVPFLFYPHIAIFFQARDCWTQLWKLCDTRDKTLYILLSRSGGNFAVQKWIARKDQRRTGIVDIRCGEAVGSDGSSKWDTAATMTDLCIIRTVVLPIAEEAH